MTLRGLFMLHRMEPFPVSIDFLICLPGQIKSALALPATHGLHAPQVHDQIAKVPGPGSADLRRMTSGTHLLLVAA